MLSLVHRGGGLTDRVEDAVEVDVHHLVPLLERIAVDREAQAADAGVGEHDIEVAELGFRLLDHRRHLFGVGDVHLEFEGLGVQFLGDLRQPPGVDVGQHEVGADVRAGLGISPPDTGCRARNQYHVAIESEAIEDAHAPTTTPGGLAGSPLRGPRCAAASARRCGRPRRRRLS